MTTYVNGNEVPASLAGKEFDYWCEAQDAKQQVKETRYIACCACAAFLGFGILIGQLFCL